MLKQDVGIRFKSFRVSQKKAQHILAGELKVHQSTITNIEHGTTFPKISYLFYFFEKYGLNINWLITGEGFMYLHESDVEEGAEPIKLPHVVYGDASYEQYSELANLMQVPVIEQVMLAKLSECRVLFKDAVSEFFIKQKEEEEAARLALELEDAQNAAEAESESERKV